MASNAHQPLFFNGINATAAATAATKHMCISISQLPIAKFAQRRLSPVYPLYWCHFSGISRHKMSMRRLSLVNPPAISATKGSAVDG